MIWCFDLAMKAVEHDGLLLEVVAPPIRFHSKIVFAAVRSDGNALEFADPSWQNDGELTIEALAHGGSMKHISEDLKKRVDFVKLCAQYDDEALKHCPDELRACKDLVLHCVRHFPMGIQFVPRFCDDLEVVKAAWNAVDHDHEAEYVWTRIGPQTRAWLKENDPCRVGWMADSASAAWCALYL